MTTKRVALFVGNAAYEHGSPLKNPISDADKMADTLRSLGFDVILLQNGTARQMKESINDFGDRLTTDCVALAYYSGHGIQSDGVNYLLPIDFDAKKRADIQFEYAS